MRKNEYKNYLETRETENFEKNQRHFPANLEWWYKEGKTLSSFDREIARIINEVDSRGE